MGGLGGLSGPAPSLWAALRGWERDTQRAMIQGFNLAMQALTMMSLPRQHGRERKVHHAALAICS